MVPNKRFQSSGAKSEGTQTMKTERAPLTELRIKSLKPAEKEYTEWDGQVPGLGVRVSPKGKKTFTLLYWDSDKKKQRLGVGTFPIISLSEARAKAREALASVSLKNANPAAEKRERKIEQKKTNQTFETVFNEYIETYAKKKMGTRTWKECERVIKADFFEPFAKRQITEITRANVKKVLDKVAERGSSAAEHAHSDIRKFFNWVIKQGEYGVEVSPLYNVDSPTQGKSRTRVLTDSELGAVFYTASNTPYPFGFIVQLLILTVQRRDRVAGMRWRDIDFKNKEWNLQSKGRRGIEFTIPLTNTPMHIINKVPRTRDSEYVFVSRTNTASYFSGFSKAKALIDISCGSKDEDGNLLWTEEWTLHDFRRAFRSNMGRLDQPKDIAERIMDHKERGEDAKRPDQIYDRFRYIPQMRKVLEVWERHVLDCTAKLRATSRVIEQQPCA